VIKRDDLIRRNHETFRQEKTFLAPFSRALEFPEPLTMGPLCSLKIRQSRTRYSQYLPCLPNGRRCAFKFALCSSCDEIDVAREHSIALFVAALSTRAISRCISMQSYSILISFFMPLPPLGRAPCAFYYSHPVASVVPPLSLSLCLSRQNPREVLSNVPVSVTVCTTG